MRTFAERDVPGENACSSPSPVWMIAIAQVDAHFSCRQLAEFRQNGRGMNR
jgi:hypothetical protein